MKNYIFYDTDEAGFAEYDIRGEEYKQLIETCCKYSTTFSVFLMNENIELEKSLKKFEIPRADNIPFLYDHYAANYNSKMKYYRVCDELCALLANEIHGIFEWLDGWGFHNPDDPTFYREDGSVFFTSVIHEGECVLQPRENEDVHEILANDLWKVLEPPEWTYCYLNNP